MKRAKISIIGAGQTGGTMAHLLALKEYANIVLYDIRGDFAKGKALDLEQSGAISGFETNIIGTDSLAFTNNSDIIVLTAGSPRKPGQSREDLARATFEVLKEIVPELARRSPEAIFIGFTNPMDVMTHVAMLEGNIAPHRVIGQGGVLDSARFRTFIKHQLAHYGLNYSILDIYAYVLGGHGESTMVPIVSQAEIHGRPLNEFLSKTDIDAVVKRTKNGGKEILELMQAGSAFYAPAAAVVKMIEAIIFDQKKILPCSVYLNGKYGIYGSFVGVLTRLGRNGIEDIIETPILATNEFIDLRKAAEYHRAMVAMLYQNSLTS